MDGKIQNKQLAKFYLQENFTYQDYFCHFFTKHNPTFVEEIRNELIPIHLEIFGEHSVITIPLSETNRALTYAINEKSYPFFASQMKVKLEVFYEKELVNKQFRQNCDDFLDNILKIITRHKLYFEETEENTKLWLIHAVLCQVESNTTDLIPYPPNLPIFPTEMRQELWKTFPKLQQVYMMLQHKEAVENHSNFDEIKHYFENLDVYFASPIFLITLPLPLFQPRTYQVSDDINIYQNEAIKLYKRHLKLYFKNIKSLLKKYGFKQYKSDNYEQTEWLVIWNKRKDKFLWEVIPHIKEFQDVDPNNLTENKRIADKIRKAFDKFRKFNLPFRPYGN